MGFIKDLETGSKAEQFVLDLFNQAQVPAFLNEDKRVRPHYDILIAYADDKWTAEIKYDLYAAKSGNIAIEYFNPKSNKPSGLGITKSDFWIHVLTNPEQAFIVRTDHFKSFVAKHKPDRIIPRGGDGNASLLLYKKDFMIQNIFIPILVHNLKQTLDIITHEYREKSAS
jgi:hypothetical protein